MPTAQAQQQAPLPGQYFDFPGIPGGATQWTEQDETTTNLVTAQSGVSQQPVNGIQQYRQTDVVADWEMNMAFTAQTYTANGATLTSTPYAPMNSIGPVKQIIQNQYASVDVENGIDLYIFNLIRPYRFNSYQALNLYANPAGDMAGSTALGYFTANLAQANQIVPAQWTNALSTYNLLLRLPAGQWFDKYFDLSVDGAMLSPPHPALVSPQFMAGTTRVITPQIFLNPGLTTGAAGDLSPVFSSTGAATFTGNATLRLRRRAAYAGNPAVLPPVYAWQYRWKTQRFTLAGVSRQDVQLPLDTGQLLSSYLRMWDPSAGAVGGAAININVLTRINLQYGSGLYWFDAQTIGGTTAAGLIQQLWFKQHANLLPQGVVGLDLALDERQQLTNGRALNTLTTAGILWHAEFTGAQSAASYVVLGTESLVYVT